MRTQNQSNNLILDGLSGAEGGLVHLRHDEGNAHTCDPQTLGNRLTGTDDVGVDELDRNGRSLNRPVPLERCSKSGCVMGR